MSLYTEKTAKLFDTFLVIIIASKFLDPFVEAFDL